MFQDRVDAGKQLAEKLRNAVQKNVIIVGLPRGGVVVAKTISRLLHIPLAALTVKKIGAPNNPELAIGAVTLGHTVFWDEEIVSALGISEEKKESLLALREAEVIERQKALGIRPFSVRKKTAWVVDDGVATGSTAQVAALYLKSHGAKVVVLVTPVITQDSHQDLLKVYDNIISLFIPKSFHAVSEFYKEFYQVSDEEVKRLLQKK